MGYLSSSTFVRDCRRTELRVLSFEIAKTRRKWSYSSHILTSRPALSKTANDIATVLSTVPERSEYTMLMK